MHHAVSPSPYEPPKPEDPQVGTSAQPSIPALSASVQVGNLTLHIGQLLTKLTPHSAELLHGALHSEIPKEDHKDLSEFNGTYSYVIGAKDYVAPVHLPRQFPAQMEVKCSFDRSMSLKSVVISDLNNGDVYCKAYFAPAAMTTLTPPHPKQTAPLASALSTSRTNLSLYNATQRGPGALLFDQSATISTLANVSGANPSGVADEQNSTAHPAPLPFRPRRTRGNGNGKGPKLPTAKPEQIDAQLYKPGAPGSFRTRKEIREGLKELGVEADNRKIERRLQVARGDTRLPSASTEDIKEIIDNNSALKLVADVIEALHAAGIGAEKTRVRKALVSAGRLKELLPKIKDSEIDNYLRDDNNQLKSFDEIARDIRKQYRVDNCRISDRYTAAQQKQQPE